MLHVGWGSRPGGARNYYLGEYDACHFFFLIVGLPVYLSFRGCVHVIDRTKIRPGERRDRLEWFVKEFLGLEKLPRRTEFPLRPNRASRWMWFFEAGLWVLGGVSLCVGLPVFSFAFLLPRPGQPDPGARAFLRIVSAITATFFVSLGMYLFLRRPSRRQARIRAVAAGWLGPFSDPADWQAVLAATAASTLGVADTTADALLGAAEAKRSSGNPVEGLLLARLGLSRIDCEAAVPKLAERAESLTDGCLQDLADNLPRDG